MGLGHIKRALKENVRYVLILFDLEIKEHV